MGFSMVRSKMLEKTIKKPGFPEHQGRAVEGLNLIPRLYGYMIPWADFLDLGHHLDANNV